MTSKNGFQILDQRVVKLNFGVNDQFVAKEDTKAVDLAPVMNMVYEKESEDKIIATMSIKIAGDDVPFHLEIFLSGFFQLTGEKMSDEALDKLVHINCAGVLFPFLRQIVADTTLKGGFQQLLLPSVNFVESYKDLIAQRKAMEEIED